MLQMRHIIVVMLCLAMALGQEKLELDKHVSGSLVANFTETYTLHLNESHKESEWNLFFVVSPVNQTLDIPKTLTIFTKKPDNSTDLQMNCTMDGIQACLLNSNFLPENTTVYINITCQDLCLYDLIAYWSSSTPITPDQPIVLDFQESAYAKLFVVDFSKFEFKQAQVILEAETFLEATSPIHLVASFGRKTPPTLEKYEIGSVHLWNDGLGIFLERDEMKEMVITILVVGPAENILKLTAHTRKDEGNELSMFSPKFDQLKPNTQRGYKIDLKKVQHLLQNDLFVKFSTFTGDLIVDFYADSNYQNLVFARQFQHMGDTQFRFSKQNRQQDGITDSLFLKVKSTNSHTTFVINANVRVQNLLRLSGQLAELSQLKSNTVDNYYVNLVRPTDSEATVTAKFIVQTYSGSPELRFSVCKGEFNTCATDYHSYENNKTVYEKLHPSHVSTTGTTSIYKIDLDAGEFSETSTDLYKSLILAVYVANPYPTKAKYSITFIDNAKVTILRENHPIKDRLAQGQEKYYKVAALGLGIKAARVHLNQISGKSNMLAYNTDPRNSQTPVTPWKGTTHNTIVFTQDQLHHPLFIVVHGDDNSFFSVTLSLLRQQSVNHQDRFTPDNFNIFVIPQHTEQQITLGSLQTEVVQLLPQQQDYEIFVQSNLHLDYCGSYNLEKYPVAPHCDFTLQTNHTEEITNAHKVLVAIHNPNNKTVRSTIKYTGKYVCEEKNTGEVWVKNIGNDTGVKCVKYHLTRREGFEIMLGMSNQQYSTANVTAVIGDEVTEIHSAYTLINQYGVEKGCRSDRACDVTLIISQNLNTLIHAVIQYTDKDITLLDGLAQNMFGNYGPDVYSMFKYHIEDKVNTTIMLESKRGYYEFYVNILNDTDYKLGWVDMYPSRSSHQYESSNRYYSMFNTLELNQEELKKHNCTKCIALITVCLKGNVEEVDGQFAIEVAQEMRHLVEHKESVGYIEASSFAYYTYFQPKNGSLFITLTTENKRCANIYLAKGTDKRAAGNNRLAQSSTNDLFYSAQQGMYSITLEAITNCHYTISSSSSDYRLYELTQGVHKDMKLEKDEYAYLFYRHQHNSSFKVMSLQDYGQVLLSANQTNKQLMQTFQNQAHFNLSEFSWHDQKDILPISHTHQKFCYGCDYLIIVHALQKTQSTFIIANPSVEIPLTTKKRITDTLAANEQINFRLMDNRKELNFTLEVLFGEVQVSVVSVDRNETRTFKGAKAPQVWAFQHGESYQQGYAMQAVKVKVRANVMTMYKLMVQSEGDNKKHTRLKKGLPTFISVGPNNPGCVDGTLQGKQHKIMISTHAKDKSMLQPLKITSKLADKLVTNFRKDIVQNTIALQYDLTSFSVTDPVKFSFCFQSQKPMDLTIVPVGSINFLAEGASLMAQGQQNLMIVPQGKFIMEVFECEGTASLTLSSSFSELRSDSSDLVHWKRFGQNYVIEADHYSPIYAQVNGTKTLLRWMHENQNKGEGMGYHLYRIPHHKYEFSGKKLVVKVPPIFKSDPNLNYFTVRDIKYTLFLSNDQTALKRGMQCNLGPLFNSSKTLTGKDDLNATLQFTFPFPTINESFSQSAYLWSSVIAQLTAITNSSTVQHYRFIYDDDQIPWGDSVRVQTVTEKNVWKLPIAILSACIGLLLVICVTRYIMIKIRSRVTFDIASEEVEVKDTDRGMGAQNPNV